MKQDLFSFIRDLFLARRSQPAYADWPEDWKRRIFRRYDRMIRTTPASTAVPPEMEGLHAVLSKRYSHEGFEPVPELDAEEIASVLAYTIGKNEMGFRLVPSGGAFYPVECYVLLRKEGVIELYHFDVGDSALRLIKRISCEKAKLKPEYAMFLDSNAAGMFLFSATIKRSFSKYGMLAIRHSLIETGIVAHSAILGLVALGYVSTMYNTYKEKDMNTILDVDGQGEYATMAILFSKDSHRE